MATSLKDKPAKAAASSLPAEHNKPLSPTESNPRSITAISVSEFHAGPLPSPEMMARYREVVPELPIILVDLLREQSQHRMSLEQLQTRSAIEHRKEGQRYAMLAVVLSLTSVTILGIYGNPWTAGIVGALEISAMVGWFIRGAGKRPSTDER